MAAADDRHGRPGSILAALSAAPRPVVIPQPSRESWSSGQLGLDGEEPALRHAHLLRVRATAARARDRLPVRPVGHVRLGHDERRALIGPAALAPVADAALGRPGHDDAIARAGARHVGADLLHDAEPRVAEDRRQLLAQLAALVHAVRDAEGARGRANDGAVRRRREQLDLLDDERLVELLQDGGLHSPPRSSGAVRYAHGCALAPHSSAVALGFRRWRRTRCWRCATARVEG